MNSLLDDEYLIRIFQCVMLSPKSAKEISVECDIPISTVYRKLRWLEENRLLILSGFFSNYGRKNKTYSKTKNLEEVYLEGFGN